MPKDTPAHCDERAVDLARRAAAGSEEAFDEMVDLLAGRVYRFLRTRGLNCHDAEDLVQETFVRAWSARARYDPAYPVTAWLFTIARRLAASHYRRRRPVPVGDAARIDVSVQASQTATDAAFDGPGPAWRTARLLLPDQDYEALWLRYGEDLPPRAVARVLGLNSLHVRVLLHRARKQLAGALDRDGTPRPNVPQTVRTGS